MGNEYKDWERDKIEEEKEIVKKYPFLQVRDINGNIDTTAKFPLMYLEIPDGWYVLFYQMCDQIKLILEEKGLLNEFYFIQVKEKYNKLVCYSNMVVDEIEDIIYDYSLIASNSCVICGAPAVYKTTDYIATYCDKCLGKIKTIDKIVPIEFMDTLETVHYISKDWERYKKSLQKQ